MSQAELTALHDVARPLYARAAEIKRQIAAERDGDRLSDLAYDLEDLAPQIQRVEEDIYDLRTYMAEKRGCYCGSTSGFCDC